MKVMAKGCKLALPRPFDLMADRLQQQQPDAYLASINEAQRTYERDMTLRGCTIFKALLDEAMRQATN